MSNADRAEDLVPEAGHDGGRMKRPLVLPEPFCGEGCFSEWVDHFDNVAAVNGWEAPEKLLWLKVRLTGRAQSAFKRFSEEVRQDYDRAVEALTRRFEPESKRQLYLAELQTKRKKRTESWADFADDLKTLVDKAYPDLDSLATEQLALTQYLGQLTNPQVAFSVKQQRPRTINEAVTATLEMEAYLVPGTGAAVAATNLQEDTQTTGAVQMLARDPPEWLKQITERLDKLELDLQRRQPGTRPAARRRSQGRHSEERGDARGPVICWRCHQEGHFARGCAEPRASRSQGN